MPHLVKQGLRYPLISLLHGWGAYFFQSGCELDLSLGCSCREDVITKAHTLQEAPEPAICRTCLPSPTSISGIRRYFGTKLRHGWICPSAALHPQCMAPSTQVGITKRDLVLQQWGVLPTFQTDKCVCIKFKWNAVRSSCHINKAPKAE